MFSDKYAVEKFKELVKEFGVKTVVETGTYKGDSTVEIAEMVDNTVSIEIKREHFEDAKKRFEGYQTVFESHTAWRGMKGHSEVSLFYGNSPEVMTTIIPTLQEPILFFLDAHWTEYWPLKDEIKAIKPRPDSLIIIHDVMVPGKDFGYDAHIPGIGTVPGYLHQGIVLNYDFVKHDLAYVNPNYKIFYNEKAAGSYRGILYAVPSKMQKEEPSMKILVISTKIFPVSGEMHYGGIERLVYLIAAGLKAQGHEVSVAAPEGSHFPPGIEHINTGPLGDFVESERVALGTYSYRLRDFDAILDLSHTHWAMIENNLPGLAFIWHDPRIMKSLEPTYNICALSEWQRSRFFQVYGYDARVVDPHCGYAHDPKPSNGRFIFIGKMGPQKGCLEAIEICRELGVPLDAIGGPSVGDPPEYLKEVKRQCNGDIVYHGEVDDRTKNTMLVEAKALIYPINYPPGQGEAHSHKSVDTMLCGIPVVTYDTGAFSEIIEHGVTGFLAKSKEEFKECMLMAHQLDRARIREIAVKRWSIEATTKRILAVAQRVAEGERWGQTKSGPVIATGS